MDVFENDDRIIDHQADREHDAEQRQHVDGVTECVDRHEASDDRNGDGDGWNDGRA